MENHGITFLTLFLYKENLCTQKIHTPNTRSCLTGWKWVGYKAFFLVFWCQIALLKRIWLKNGKKMPKKLG